MVEPAVKMIELSPQTPAERLVWTLKNYFRLKTSEHQPPKTTKKPGDKPRGAEIESRIQKRCFPSFSTY